MTALQVINSLFGILIYPYLIRTLGAGSYGLYIFAMSVSSYFIKFISFGFNYPAVKAIVENKDNLKVKSEIISSILSAKIYLGFISIIIFYLLVNIIPIMKNNWMIFSICFLQIFGEILFPVWYFQAIQKMKNVTFIQLGFRVLSLPFIFFLIKNPTDNNVYALITTLCFVLGGIVSIFIMVMQDHIYLKLISIKELKIYFHDAMPFFWSSSTGTIKQESVTIIIGTFFGMRDVAIYDLANKIIILPRILTMSLNSSIFPKVIENIQKSFVKKIIRYETYIGLLIIIIISITGYWIVMLLGGKEMLEAYPLSIVLSATVLVWLVVGSYISFIFVPQNKYYYVTQNQFVAFISFFVFCIPCILIIHSIMSVVLALTLSGFCEILYCNYLIKKHKML
jgi:PST family polysaccharide transporter